MLRPSKSVLLPALLAVALVAAAVVAFVTPGLLVHSHHDAAPTGRPAPTTTTSTTTSLGGVAPMAPGWLKLENTKAGATDWRLTRPAHKGEIEGYASAISVQRGDVVRLFVSTTAPTFTVRGYRMGFYGGAGAHLVWSPPAQTGSLQARPAISPATHMVEASWTPSLTVTVGPDWAPGDYLFKLVSATGFESFIPLTVRDDQSTTGLLINNSVTTWQAYNLWGGYSLYSGATAGGQSFANRARTVSFDRPYQIGDGSGDFLGNEFPFVSLVESLGNDVSYTTDVDLDLHPELLLRHHALISLGHDEYWSRAMRDGVETARDRGVNFAFLGANAIFRPIRLASSPLGAGRHEIAYKSAAEDPLTGVDNADVTSGSWREPPNNRPENVFLGEMYQCNPVSADFIVYEPSSWIFDGTGVHKGQRIIKAVGSEYDQYLPGPAAPKNVEVIAHSPLTCRATPGFSDFTYYSAASGAGVLDTGTNNWVPLLTNPDTQPVIVRVTENILAAFSSGPAGVAHPSAGNTAGLPRPVTPRTPPPESPSTTATTTPHPTTVKHATTTAATTPPTTAATTSTA
jgi:hypothetical protein